MNNNRLWVLGTVIFVVAVLALGWFLGIQPKLVELSASDRAVAEVEVINEAEYNKLLALKKEFEDIDSVRDQIDELRVSIPNTAELSDFIRQINALAASTGVSITAINTGEPVVFELPEAPVVLDEEGLPVTAPALPENFVRIPMSIVVVGDPSAVMKFVQGLQAGDRLFLATTFGVVTDLATPSEDEDAPPPTTVATATIGGNIYVLVIKDLPETVNETDEDASPTPTPTPTVTSTPTPTPTPTNG